jgi:hypothetical protein
VETAAHASFLPQVGGTYLSFPNLLRLSSQLIALTGRHASAAWVAVGSPAANKTCS